MRAILLAAGFGTRLQPLTSLTPKCLVPINSKPLLDIWLDKLTFAGIGPFIVNTHYLADQVSNYIKRSRYQASVSLVYESNLLGTAGTLIKNKDFFCGEDGMLIHADNYCGDNLVGFLEAHENRPPSCLMTMMTFRTDTPSSCGIVKTNDRGIVVEFYEKVLSPPSNLANGAIYILSKEMIKYISKHFNSAKDFSEEILPKFTGKIFSYETSGIFMDIGTPEKYKLANNFDAKK